MKLWKYSGTFLVITGVIHTVYALLLGKEDFTDMIKDGLINSTDGQLQPCFRPLVFSMWDYTYSLGANTPILYQKRAETCTSGFGVLHFSLRCGWMYHRADFRFLAVFAASISYNCCK